MKKSTLFFKVMVLVALLVPWAAWGQEDATPMASNDAIWGTGPTIYINSEGEISEDGVKYSDKITIQFDDVQDQNDGNWQFGDEVDPSTLPITVSPSSDGKSVTLSVKENADISEISEVTFKVAADNNGGQRKGWIQFGLSTKSKTDITDDTAITITINGGVDSKIYDGDAISISVETVDGTELVMGTDYRVYIDNNTTAITTTEGLPKDVKSEDTEEEAYSIVIEGIGDHYYGKTTAKTVTITRRPITVTLKDDPKLEFEIGESATNLDAENYAQYFNIQANTTDAGLAESESAKVDGAFSVNTTSAGAVVVNTENLKLVDSGNGSFDVNNYNVSWGADGKGLTATVNKKEFNDENIIVSFTGLEQASKEYDGKPIPEVVVKDKDGNQITEGYKVTYQKEDGTSLDAAPSDAGKYKVIVTSVSDKSNYGEGSVTANFEITKKKLVITGTMTVKQDDQLESSISVENNNAFTWNYKTMVEGETVSVKGTVTPIDGTAKTDVVTTEPIPNAFSAKGGEEGSWSLELTGDAAKNYTIESISISLMVEKKDIVDVEGNQTITIKPSEGEGGEVVIKENSDNNEVPYIGYPYDITKIGDIELPAEVTEGNPNITITNTKSNETVDEIKDAGNYKVEIEYTVDGKKYTATQTVEVTKATLTVTVLQQKLTVTELSSEAINNNSELKKAIEESEDATKATVTIVGEKGEDKVEFEEGSVISFVTPQDGKWMVGKNASALTAKTGNGTLALKEPYATNYELKLNPGDLILNYEINNDNEDKVEVVFSSGDDTKYYDAVPVTGEDVTVKVNGIELEEGRDYDLSFGLGVTSIKDAGDYMIAVNFTGYYIGTKNVNYYILKRPLKLQFSFDNDIQEGETLKLGDNVSLEVASDASEDNEENMGFAANEANEFNAWLNDGSISATFKVHTEAVDGKYPVELETITFPKEGENLKYSNYDVTYIVMGADLKPSEEHPLLDEDEQAEQEGGDDYTHEGDGDIIGGFEPVDNSGHGTITGTNYRKNRLYLADRDFYFNDLYDEEGLILYSRHDKKYTEDGGSFTIWYEHNGEVNEGGYRIFISSKKNKDYKEVKLDEVSGYYQIRNVQSDIYVKIYAMDGFPVANEEITATDARAYAQANKIVVITPEPTDVQIISMAGAVVATDQVTGQREFANLAEGVYIVRMGETVIKLQVRN